MSEQYANLVTGINLAMKESGFNAAIGLMVTLTRHIPGSHEEMVTDIIEAAIYYARDDDHLARTTLERWVA